MLRLRTVAVPCLRTYHPSPMRSPVRALLDLFSSVKLGDISLNDVDGVVHEKSSLPVVLLGMSFLGQLEMRREGKSLTLTKRY